MQPAIVQLAELIARAIELVMLAVISVGTIATIAALIRGLIKGERMPALVHQIWMRYAAWILLALEFALAADLIDTIIAPTWEEIGQLGAIAGIRIALGYFLGRDISEYGEAKSE